MIRVSEMMLVKEYRDGTQEMYPIGNVTGMFDNGTRLDTYVPVAAQRQSQAFNIGFGSVSDDEASQWQDVRESARLVIPITIAGRELYNTYESLFEDASLFDKYKIGPKIFIYFRTSSTDDWWRSLIKKGGATLDVQAFDWQASTESIGCTLAWERQYYWEGEEVELQLSNKDNVTPTTGGIVVRNHTDSISTDSNYVHIAADEVSGVLRTPVVIRMENNTNDGFGMDDVWVGQNILSEPDTFDHILQGADASFAVGGIPPGASAGASDGTFQQVQWSGTTETEIIAWDLSATLMSEASGNWFRVMIRPVSVVDPDWLFRIKVKIAGIQTIWESLQVEAGGSAVIPQANTEIGVVQLPPGIANVPNLGSLDLYLSVETGQVGTHNYSIDFVQLTPLDGWRKYINIGFGTPFQDVLVDDGINGYVYRENSAGEGLPNYRVEGEPFLLYPKRSQRFYFRNSRTTGTGDIDREIIVSMFYRPRRVTI